MPQDRLLHAAAGHSDRVSSLTDFEARVWAMGYLFACDDYGVMRYSAVTVQAVNDALERRSVRELDKALRRLVEVGLLHVFEHQGKSFVCQLDWQDWQSVRYPRESLNPVPPPEVLERCSAKTRELWQKRLSENAETFRSLPCAGAGERLTAMADGERLTANGERRPPRPRTFGRIDLHRWQLDSLIAMLGPHAATFDLDAWVLELSQAADRQGLVLTKQTLWPWVQAQLRDECQRRGLPMAVASEAPALGKQSARLIAAVANLEG